MATQAAVTYTDTVPQIAEIREYILRGVAAMQPKATNATLMRWMVVQNVIFQPAFALKVLDDLIAARFIGRDLTLTPCGCKQIEVYVLTDLGHAEIALILSRKHVPD